MPLHNKQKDIVRSNARFKIIRAGRRAGKTTLETEVMVFKAVSGKDRNVFYVAPTQKQARSIIWEALKKRLAGIGEANESRLEMKVPTVDGGYSTIFVSGWENRENFRGMKAQHITFDELDTMKDFFIGWQEIFRPALTDTAGTADFIGTPKKENPNLRRLEKIAVNDIDFATFNFKTSDNPHIPEQEIIKAQKELDGETFKQEYLAEYVDNSTSLFKYDALIDMFTNTVDTGQKYLTIDPADDGVDSTKFAFWDGLELYRMDTYKGLQTEGIIEQIRQSARLERIPYSHIAVDAIGIGAGVASSHTLNGIVGFKGSYAAIKTEANILIPANQQTLRPQLVTDYRNLRSQCVFKLAEYVNGHKIAVRIEDGKSKENIIEELSTYQDVSKGDGKKLATPKEDMKELLGRSPDDSDTMQMRMYFELQKEATNEDPVRTEQVSLEMAQLFIKNRSNRSLNTTK